MLGDLQCNILKSHGRDFAHHLFLQFTAPAGGVRAWLRGLAGTRVTSARTQFEESLAFKATGRKDAPIVAVLLSASGYRYLGLDPDEFRSRSFRDGMKHCGIDVVGAVLNTSNKDPDPSRWEAGFRGDIHALVVLANDVESALGLAVAAVTAEFAGVATVAAAEAGNTLRLNGGEPVEHFGYLDGRSNPAFTKSDMDKERQREGDGVKVWDPSAPLSLVLVRDPFAAGGDAFGSFLVFRKLGQDIPAFNARVADLAKDLAVPPALAGALVVGRFKDGTPVVRADAPGLGAQNSFAFTEDGGGSKCPFHAHIRKVNPRGTTPLTSEKSERGRRIARRGIPYGKPIANAAPPAAPTPRRHRAGCCSCASRPTSPSSSSSSSGCGSITRTSPARSSRSRSSATRATTRSSARTRTRASAGPRLGATTTRAAGRPTSSRS